MRSPQEPNQQKALETMRDTLAEDFLSLVVHQYELRENFDDDYCVVTCKVEEQPSGQTFNLEGKGVGLLDAFFHALCAKYEDEHPSLHTIRFSSFLVRGLMGDASANTASDAKAEAIVGITNSSGVEFQFGAVSPSVSHSSIEATVAAVEYFVNSERAYVRLYRALQHHKGSGRPELVAKYTELLGEMVRNTSYSSAVERIKTGG